MTDKSRPEHVERAVIAPEQIAEALSAIALKPTKPSDEAMTIARIRAQQEDAQRSFGFQQPTFPQQ